MGCKGAWGELPEYFVPFSYSGFLFYSHQEIHVEGCTKICHHAQEGHTLVQCRGPRKVQINSPSPSELRIVQEDHLSMEPFAPFRSELFASLVPKDAERAVYRQAGHSADSPIEPQPGVSQGPAPTHQLRLKFGSRESLPDFLVCHCVGVDWPKFCAVDLELELLCKAGEQVRYCLFRCFFESFVFSLLLCYSLRYTRVFHALWRRFEELSALSGLRPDTELSRDI
mmetsp:Transcript_25666/g.50250  ORF Transcript_25666/g.50250 Transcript_25666/m.50250 type:complete len:226 (+) Transcript_25666:307-984(+)